MQLLLYTHILCALTLFTIEHSNGQQNPNTNELLSLFSNEGNTNVQTIQNTYASTFSSFQNTDQLPPSGNSDDSNQSLMTTTYTMNTQTISTDVNPSNTPPEYLYYPQTANPSWGSTTNGQSQNSQSSANQQNQYIPTDYEIPNDGSQNSGYYQDYSGQSASYTYPNSQTYPPAGNTGLLSGDLPYSEEQNDYDSYILPQTANPNPYQGINGFGNGYTDTNDNSYGNSQNNNQMDNDYYQSYLNSHQNAQPTDSYANTGLNNGEYGTAQNSGYSSNNQGYGNSGLGNDLFSGEQTTNGDLSNGYYNPQYDYTDQYNQPSSSVHENQAADTQDSSTKGSTSNSQNNNEYQPNSQSTGYTGNSGYTGSNSASKSYGNNQSFNGNVNNNDMYESNTPSIGTASDNDLNSGNKIITSTFSSTYIVQEVPGSSNLTPMPIYPPNYPPIISSENGNNKGTSSEECEDEEDDEEEDLNDNDYQEKNEEGDGNYFVYDSQGNIIGINHKDSDKGNTGISGYESIHSNNYGNSGGYGGGGGGFGYGGGGGGFNGGNYIPIGGYNGMFGGTAKNTNADITDIGQDNAEDEDDGNTFKNSDTGQALKNLGGDVSNTTKNAVKNVGNAVDDTAADAINGVDQLGGDAYNATKDAAKNVGNAVDDTAAGAINGVDKFGGEVKNTTADALHGVGNAADATANATKNAYQDTKDFGNNLKQDGNALGNEVVGEDEDTHGP